MYDRLDGGRLIGRALSRHGVDRIFALQGGHIDPILYGCVNEDITVFDTRHEQGAALMAEGWALATGQTGVCAVTAGPGLTNAVTGIANAFFDGSPVLCLAGKRPTGHADVWTLQDLDQLRLVEPITRWARSVNDAARAGEYVRMALAEAKSGKPGPVYLDFPADVVSRPVDAGLLDAMPPPVAPEPPAPDGSVVERIAALLESSERPLIVAGSGAHWAHAGPEIGLLASALGIPVFTANAGRGSVPDNDPWCMGAAQPVGGGFLTAAPGADVVVCLGVRMGFLFMNGKVFQEATRVRVDIDRGELSRNTPSEIEVVCDVGAFCRALLKCVSGDITPARREWAALVTAAARSGRKEFDAIQSGPSGGIHPAAVVKTMARVGGDDATYVTDGGDAMTFGMARFPANAPGQLLGTSVYFGALGVGIPYAIAAKLARPDAPCLLWEGDGAFGFNAFEFDTALRHAVPVVAVVADNGTWGMSMHGQGLQYGYDQLVATELGHRPYHEVVRALGGYGERVESLDQLQPALERALASETSACIDVLIDRAAVSVPTMAMASIGLG